MLRLLPVQAAGCQLTEGAMSCGEWVYRPFGLDAVKGRAHGIFGASVFVVGALGVMCMTLNAIVGGRR